MSELTFLHQTFSNSEYGQELVQRTRFNDFKPDFVGTEMWGRLLGQDVNNLGHMPHTTELAGAFAGHNDLDPLTTRLLKTTAITHDWGEAIIGDIALPAKTAEDETREQIAWRHIANDLLGSVGDELGDDVWSILNHRDAERGDMFRAVEYVGYCTTAMRAGKVATGLAHGFVKLDISRAQKEQLMGGLLGMEKAVSVHNFPTLAKYVDKYPGVEQMLWEYRDDL